MTTESAKAPPRGIYVPIPTFFYPDDSQSLDLETTARYCQHLRTSGITGLVLLGSTGEAVHVTPEERHELIATVRRTLPHPYPIVVGTATQSIPETVAQLEAAFGAGADFGMVLCPGYFAGPGNQTDQAAIARWYTHVADASPIPILVYNFPAVSNGLEIHPHTLVRLSKHPNIVGAKLSHGDVTAISRILLSPDVEHQERFRVFTGLGGMLAALHGLGIGGAIDSLAGIYPKSMVALWENAEHGEKRKEMLFLQWAVAEGEELVGKGGVGMVKGTLKRMGWGTGGCRALIKTPETGFESNLETLEVMEKELTEVMEQGLNRAAEPKKESHVQFEINPVRYDEDQSEYTTDSAA